MKATAQIILASAFLFLIASCSHAPDPTVTYVLPNPELATSSETSQHIDITVRDIHLANYLNQGGFVIKRNEVEIAITQNNRWGEPLEKGIKRYLNRKLAALEVDDSSTNPDQNLSHFAIELTIDAYEAHLFQSVSAIGSWSLYSPDSNTPLMSAGFSFHRNLKNQSYEGIVKGFAVLLDDIATDIEKQTIRIIAHQ